MHPQVSVSHAQSLSCTGGQLLPREPTPQEHGEAEYPCLNANITQAQPLSVWHLETK